MSVFTCHGNHEDEIRREDVASVTIEVVVICEKVVYGLANYSDIIQAYMLLTRAHTP